MLCSVSTRNHVQHEISAERSRPPEHENDTGSIPADQPERLRLTILVATIAVAVLCIHAASHLPFISDDASITLRYAQRLLEGHGLTWTDGPRVEGYTNLLWLLACAALGALGVDLDLAARVLGVVCMSAALVAVVWARPPRSLPEVVPPLAGALALALTGAFAVWAIGGLEQPLLAALLAWAFVLLFPVMDRQFVAPRRNLAAGFLLGLLCLTRADAAVLCLGIGLGLLTTLGFGRRAWRAVILLAVFPLLLTAGQTVFRLLYYGDFVPNSAHVKVAFSFHRLSDGLNYVTDGALAYAALIVPALAAIVPAFRHRALRPRILLPAAVLLTWLAYLAVIGGDIFPARRQWVPALVALGLLLIEFLWYVQRHWPRGRANAAGAAVLCVAVLVWQQSAAREYPTQLAREERWEWDGKLVGEFLKEAFSDRQPLLAVDGAGAVPYYSELPAIDMLGINDHHIARHAPPDFGKGWVGHELGDGRYVLDRKPDVILFERPPGQPEPVFRSGMQMWADPAFQRDYRLLLFELPILRLGESPFASGQDRSAGEPVLALLWLRAYDGRIGIQQTDRRLEIPGYLLATPPWAAAAFDDQRQLVTHIRPDGAGVLPRLPLGAGRWHISADGQGPLTFDIRLSGTTQPIAAGPLPATFDITPPARVYDLIMLADKPAELRQLVLERSADTKPAGE